MPRRRAFPVALFALALVASACTWRSPVVHLEIPAAAETSRVYAADGTLLTSLHAEEDRELVPLSRIPQVLREAVVAIEDERFWAHRGVDLQAIVRAARENASEGRVVEGGSTITQQYVKVAIIGRDRDVRRKVREASLAYQLEQTFTKARILELYLNSVYFGNGAYGVEAASHEYFGRSVDDLGLAEAALLAGIIRSPNATDPFDHPDVATRRRNVVLDKMAELAKVPLPEAEAAKASPLGLRAPEDRRRYAAPHFVERVKRFVLDDPMFGATPKDRRDLLFRGGLRIHTTLDLAVQAQAEEAVDKVLSKPERDPSAGLVSLNPKNGHVRALVGGRDFFGGGAEAKFDLATQGRRPAGSAFKPFVLAAALKEGVTLERVYNAPPRIRIPLGGGQGIWNVSNYEGSGGGRMSLWEATVASSNTVYAQLIMDIGPEKAVATAAEMGIASPLQPYPSAVLGTNDVTVLDMAAAYGTLANRGLATKPTFVTRITNSSGKVLYRHRPGQKRVLSPGLVSDEVDVLQQVVNRGTGVHARIGRPVAGKTGTGQAWRDAWFVGFTPDLVTAVWVGFPHEQRSMVPPATRIRVTGGSWPAEIWQLHMSAVLAQSPVTPFPLKPPPTTIPQQVTTPRGDPRIVLDSVIGLPAAEGKAVLERQGFRVTTRIVPNPEYPPGYVVRQTPSAGTQVRPGATISLQISEAALYTPVPDVLGLQIEDAKASLERGGFIVKTAVQSEPPTEGVEPVPGAVWKQNPVGGTLAADGTVVRIWVNP